MFGLCAGMNELGELAILYHSEVTTTTWPKMKDVRALRISTAYYDGCVIGLLGQAYEPTALRTTKS